MKINEMHMACPECGGPAFTDMLLAEKKDACYYKVKASAKVWPSAYASGRLVQCRKKGAANYGNKSESADQLAEKCWDTHRQVGMKKKGNRIVPDCVPKEGMAEGTGNIGAQIRAVYKKIYDAGDDAVEFVYYDSPIFAQYWDEYEGDLDSIIAEVEPSELQIILDELTAAAEDQGVAEGSSDDIEDTRQFKNAIALAKSQKAIRQAKYGKDTKFYADGTPVTPKETARRAAERKAKNQVKEAGSPAQQAAIAINMKKKGKRPMNEYNAEYDDEAGMADNNLETLRRAVDGLDDLIGAGDNLPEWCQEKIAVAKSMLVNVWDYMASEEERGADPEVEEMYEAMEQLVAEMAHKHGTSTDLVWEQFEALPDRVLFETAAWRRKEGKSAKGGLNRKGVASYRREHPGSKLQMAVTTKPSKLKKGSKAAKRRKSFCARMSGVKGPMKKPNGKPTRKALALRKWNC
jgi:hypothetical protein